MEELFKSFTSGMWELEQTFKYDLRQHVLVKLFIFGFIDFLIVLSFSILTNLLFRFSFSMLLYLLVPYNIVCIVLFLFSLVGEILAIIVVHGPFWVWLFQFYL